MSTSKADIREWLKRGKKEGATHMVVVCDTYDHTDYPVFVKTAEDAKKRADAPGEMQRVMEVYALHLDWETQLAEHRAFHFDPPSTAYQTKQPSLTKAQREALERFATDAGIKITPTLRALERRGLITIGLQSRVLVTDAGRAALKGGGK